MIIKTSFSRPSIYPLIHEPSPRSSNTKTHTQQILVSPISYLRRVRQIIGSSLNAKIPHIPRHLPIIPLFINRFMPFRTAVRSPLSARPRKAKKPTASPNSGVEGSELLSSYTRGSCLYTRLMTCSCAQSLIPRFGIGYGDERGELNRRNNSLPSHLSERQTTSHNCRYNTTPEEQMSSTTRSLHS